MHETNEPHDGPAPRRRPERGWLMVVAPLFAVIWVGLGAWHHAHSGIGAVLAWGNYAIGALWLLQSVLLLRARR